MHAEIGADHACRPRGTDLRAGEWLCAPHVDGSYSVTLLPLYPNRGQKLQIRDDVINVVVCQDNLAAEGKPNQQGPPPP